MASSVFSDLSEEHVITCDQAVTKKWDKPEFCHWSTSLFLCAQPWTSEFHRLRQLDFLISNTQFIYWFYSLFFSISNTFLFVCVLQAEKIAFCVKDHHCWTVTFVTPVIPEHMSMVYYEMPVLICPSGKLQNLS